MQDTAFMDAIKKFEARGAHGAVQLPAGATLCSVYKDVKPILTAILPFIRLIPVWGATVATAIEALMSFLDKECPNA